MRPRRGSVPRVVATRLAGVLAGATARVTWGPPHALRPDLLQLGAGFGGEPAGAERQRREEQAQQMHPDSREIVPRHGADGRISAQPPCENSTRTRENRALRAGTSNGPCPRRTPGRLVTTFVKRSGNRRGRTEVEPRRSGVVALLAWSAMSSQGGSRRVSDASGSIQPYDEGTFLPLGEAPLCLPNAAPP